MRFTSLMMYISPLLLFIFYVYVGFSEAAPPPRISDASPAVLPLFPGKEPPRSAFSSDTSSPELSSNTTTTTMPKKRSPDHDGIIMAHHVGPLTALVEPSPTIVSAPPDAAITTLQPPSSSADDNTDVIIPTTMEQKITAATSDVSSRRRKRSSSDAQTSVFPPKMLQTMVSMVSSQHTANDAWSADHVDATSITSTESSREVLCNCSSGSEGILDPEDCEPSTGQCSCLTGHTGLQCEDCEVGHFTNGTTGCLPCGCDSFGAVNNLCDSSGICVCKTGVYGPKCDECHPGFFRFSSTGCQPCQCNNHTNYCHPQSGVCLNCLDNTQGANCEECKPKHYRSVGAALTDTCAPCPCFNTTSTGSCHTDSDGFPVCDQCLPQYRGSRCDECSAGFYKLAGQCVPCECSGNADPKGPAQICHPDTGHCLRCGNNTMGLHCQLCAPDFTGDARAHNCSRAASRIVPTPAGVTTTGPPKSSTSSPTPPATSTPSTTASSTSASPRTTNTSTVPPRAASTSTTTAAQTLLTSLGSPTDNTTAARTEVSWTQFNIIILAVIILVVLLLLGFVGGVYTYREYQNRKLNAPFWTIELKEDNISFSSYHDSIPNADVSGLLEDEANEVAPNGQLALTTQGNCYSKA